MRQMSFEVMFIYLMFVTALGKCASSSIEEKRPNQKDIATNFMKLNEKIDYLSKQVDILEANASTGNNAFDMENMQINITRILNAIETLNKKTDKFEEILHEILKKSDEILQNITVSEAKNDIISEMTSQCNSMCESKVNNLVNESTNKFKDQLKKLEFWKNDNSTTTDMNDGKSLKSSSMCDPNPCLNGGHCEVINDYQCTKCPSLTKGKNCEKINCKENKCFQRNDVHYVLFEDQKNWEQANQKCISEGMTLSMPKGNDKTEYIKSQLRTIFGAKTRKNFWFGLKYNANQQQWQWIDGTALGDYNGGKTNFKSTTGELCGSMFIDHATQTWDAIKCGGTSGHEMHTLCEKH